MSNSFLLLLGIATPLIAALFSYLTRYNNNLRDSFGIIGGIVTLIISLRVFHGIQSNEIFEITLFNLFEGVDFTFRVTPLGSIFSLVASSLWIMASIYTIGYMRGAGEKNQTRFVILQNNNTIKNNNINKASLKFELDHKRGSLATILNVLSDCKLNLTKIQSMPKIQTPWRYSFFVDVTFDKLEYYLKAKSIIEIMAKEFKVLGEYKNSKDD